MQNIGITVFLAVVGCVVIGFNADFFKWFINFLDRDMINVSVALLVVVLFTLSIILVLFPYRKAKKEMVNAKNNLEGITIENINIKYGSLKSKFIKDDYFRDQWRELDETLRKIRVNDETRYYNTVDVSYFFNVDTLFYHRFNNFSFSMPNILTGIGILGTFLGLVAGLEGFEGINFSITSAVTKASEALLHGVSASFMTSVLGIGFSIALNLFLTYLKNDIEKKIYGFTECLEEIFPRHISAEGEGLFEIKSELETQTKALDSFATKIANAVGQSVSSTIEESLRPSIDKMSAVMEKFSEQKSESITESLKEMVTDFRNSISGAAKDEMDNVVKTVTGIADTLDTTQDNFTRVLSKLENIGTEQSKSLESAKETSEEIGAVVVGVNTAMKQLKETTKVQKEILDDAKTVTESFAAAKNTVERLSGYTEQVAVTISKTESMMDNLKESLNVMLEVNKATSALAQENKSYTESIKDVLGDMDDSLNSVHLSTDKISSAVNDLANVKDYFTQTNTLVKNFDEYNNKIQMFTSKADELMNSIHDTSESTNELWESYRDTYQDIQDGIEKGISDYTTAISENSTRLFQEYDEALSNGLSGINRSVKGLTSEMDNLSDVISSVKA